MHLDPSQLSKHGRDLSILQQEDSADYFHERGAEKLAEKLFQNPSSAGNNMMCEYKDAGNGGETSRKGGLCEEVEADIQIFAEDSCSIARIVYLSRDAHELLLILRTVVA